MKGPTGPTGPTGATGPCCCHKEDFLSAYSVSLQTTKNGETLKFASNAVTNGSAISHVPGSADFIIHETGFYRAAFHGTIYPTKETNLPLTVTLTQNLQGSGIPGGQNAQMFHTPMEGENVAFSQFFRVTTVPSTFNIAGSGGAFLSSAISLSIDKMSDF